ncbi:MAG: hypothetical protein MRZ79_00410, partial [Bacteroidia bacterium]|nr:hypothetical protein [Bacteroidia bacterium]
MNLKLFILFLIASTSLSIAQTPSWDYILENDFEKAKEGFSKELEQDSTNIQSLLGAIFIADIYQDRSRFHKLSNLLFKHSNDPMVWNAFLSSSTPLVEKKKLISHPYLDTPEGKIAGMVALYFKDPYDKHISYEETKSKFDPIYQNDGWAFIGPFKNINGYSHLEVYPPELSRSPDWNASYDNEVGLKLKWIRPKYHAPSGQINIKDFLSTKTNTNLFYAHKSVFLPEEKKLQLRIKRELPMKLWVDGKLVFDNPNPIGSVLSGEILELDLTKGRHDILVKLSKFDGWQSYSGKFPFTSIYSYGRGNNYNFNVRFTDLNGTPLALPKGTQKQAEGQLLTYKQLDTDIIKAMINKLTASSEESRTNLSSYYVLARYAVKAKKTREVEKFFVELEKKMPNSTYIDLLLATIYERNGNRALSFRTVSKIDLEKTPHYATLNKKLNELDQKVDKDLYEEKLEFLRAIAPSNENM